MGFDLDPNYIDVATRLSEFRSKHPDGSLQQVSVDFRDFAGTSWVIYTAAAYRSPDDARPGQGTAWEPVPGRTPYTKGSELQNAETAAWGRAIVAALAADTNRGVASAEEVRNRTAERQAPRSNGRAPEQEPDLKTQVWEASKRIDPALTDDDRRAWIRAEIAANSDDEHTSMLALLDAWGSAT